jgi:uncharacterized protein YciI
MAAKAEGSLAWGDEMATRIAYFYFMKNEPGRIQAVAPRHHQYWKQRELSGFSGGPFADRSGGLITFEAEGIEQARELIENDPFVLEDLLESRWVKEWAAS